MKDIIKVATFVSVMIISGKVLVFGDTASVNYEKYVPHVLIQGKWGDGPGEFHYYQSEGQASWPHSFAVNSKEEIFILDQYNNRIQKFFKDGKYKESIPIQSFKLSTNEEIKESKKSWNKIGNPFPTILMYSIELVGDSIYAIQERKENNKSKKEVLKLRGSKFYPIDLKEDKAFKLNNFIDNQSILEARKNILSNKKKFKIIYESTGNSKIERLTYDGFRIMGAFIDKEMNLYVENNNEIRKYNSKENLVFYLDSLQVGFHSSVYVSEKGDIFIFKLYAQKEDSSYSIDQYEGMWFIKWSLEK